MISRTCCAYPVATGGRRLLSRMLCALLLVVVTTGFSPAQAAVTLQLFENKEAFLVATGAASATGPLPDLGQITTGSATVGSVTFSLAPGGDNFFIGASGVPGVEGDWCAASTGNDIALGFENLEVQTGSPVYALGFDFVEPGANAPEDCSPFAPPVDSPYHVTLFAGPTQVGEFDFNAPDDEVGFAGVWSDIAFDRVQIIDSSGNHDDEYFGEFYTAALPPSSPPSVDHVWGGCRLTQAAVSGLESGVSADGEGPLSSPLVDFVLVYSLQNDNDGQLLGTGYTGPILCTNPNNVNLAATGENTPIGTLAAPVEITALEGVLFLQHETVPGVPSSREKRVCHTVAGNTDCFLIRPASPSPPIPAPSPDHVWGGCQLSEAAVTALNGSLAPAIGSPQIDFVMVYSLQNDNDGQSLVGGHTGPVLCINPDNVAVEPTNENTSIGSAMALIDITALEQASILQYEKVDGLREKRVCHNVAGNTDCFLITSAPSEE